MRISDWSSDVCSSDLEAAHLEALTEAAIGRREAIAASCDILARIDVAAALADHAMSHGWCRPDLADEPCLDVSGGRHPVVEAALAKSGERFVPNDVSLSEAERLRTEEHTSEPKSLMRTSY